MEEIQTIRYRNAVITDVPFMTQILLDAAAVSGHFIEAERLSEYPDTEIYVKGWQPDKECGVIAESKDGKPIGAAWIRNIPELGHNINDPLPELTIGVLPAYRRRGIGVGLMNKLYVCCRNCNIPEISLGVHQNNIPAVKLYEKQGWHMDGKYKEYLMMSYRV